MQSISVMLVDDNVAFLRAARQFLDAQKDMLVVGMAAGGEEALTQVENLQPQVILVDLAMTGLSGLETIPRLRKTIPEAGIIALTLLNANHFKRAALKAGADDFIPKALMRTDLLPAIRKTARNGSVVPEKPVETIADNGSNTVRHVLILEDNADLSRVYSKALRSAGYEVRTEATIQQARDSLDSERFDVMLCDIHVGDDHGTDLLREYADKLAISGTQVIMVSGQAQYRGMCEEMGADFFLEKPVAINTLVALVDRLSAR